MKTRFLGKVLSLLLAGALLTGLVPVTAVDYPDMPTDWAHDAVQAGVDAGLIVPDGEGKLNPAKALTRAEVADIMVRAFGSGGKADLSSFRDIPADHPYREALAGAVYMGLMSGGGGKMDPDGPVTREQAFVILGIRVLSDLFKRDLSGILKSLALNGNPLHRGNIAFSVILGVDPMVPAQ